MRADRLLEIVALLRTHGRLSAAELARRLEVTQRTVLRDMDALSAAGVPVYAERGRRGGFSLLPGYRPALEELTADETRALLLTGSGTPGSDRVLHRALRKLSASVGPDQVLAAERARERIVVDPGGWFGTGTGTGTDPSHVGTVQEAVLGDRRLRIDYRGRNDVRARQRTIDPWGMLQAGTTWYVVAAHRGRPHAFRLDRIETAQRLPEPARRPEGLDLRAVWLELRDGFGRPPDLTIRVEVRGGSPAEVLMMLAAVASGRPRLSEGQHSGAPVLVEVEVLGLRPAVAALAGLGDRVRVLDPPELVDALLDTLAAARACYADHDGRASRAGNADRPVRTSAP